MPSLRKFAFPLVLAWLLALGGCSLFATGPSETELLMKKNQELEQQNKDLAQRLDDLKRERQQESQTQSSRLESMDRAIIMMEESLTNLQAKLKENQAAQAAAPPAPAPAPSAPAPKAKATPAAHAALPAGGLPLGNPKAEPATKPAPLPAPEPDSAVGAETEPGTAFTEPEPPSLAAPPAAKAGSAPLGLLQNPQGKVASSNMVAAEPAPEAVAPAPVAAAAATGAFALESYQPVVKEDVFSDPDLAKPNSPIQLSGMAGAKQSYNEAYKEFSKGNHETAIELFHSYLHRFPNDVDADNAQYWVGLSYYEINALEGAEEAFRKVLTYYAHGPTQAGFKTPDAILMLGKIHKKRLRPDRARYYFYEVMTRYPESQSAVKAKEEAGTLHGPRR